MERQWRQPVACSRNSTARPVCAALDGDSRRCQYAYLQSSTIDGARWHSMTDRYFTGAWRRKFWTFQNFRTATVGIGAQWRSAAFTHGCVCALWRSTASIHVFLTAAERRQKPPMCNSGFNFRVIIWVPQIYKYILHQGVLFIIQKYKQFLIIGWNNKTCFFYRYLVMENSFLLLINQNILCIMNLSGIHRSGDELEINCVKFHHPRSLRLRCFISWTQCFINGMLSTYMWYTLDLLSTQVLAMVF